MEHGRRCNSMFDFLDKVLVFTFLFSVGLFIFAFGYSQGEGQIEYVEVPEIVYVEKEVVVEVPEIVYVDRYINVGQEDWEAFFNDYEGLMDDILDDMFYTIEKVEDYYNWKINNDLLMTSREVEVLIRIQTFYDNLDEYEDRYAEIMDRVPESYWEGE